MSTSTLSQKKSDVQFKREADVLVGSLPSQSVGLEPSGFKKANSPKQGWSGGAPMLSVAKGSSAEVVMLCHIAVLIIFFCFGSSSP